MRTPWITAALVALGLVGASAGTAQARDGCGLGFHRGFYGYCRPNLGPRFYRPYAYRPAFYGYRRFGWGGPRWHRWGGWGGPRRFGWHRWGGFRHAGWGGGWHRGWHGGGWHHRW